jgi:hypothetical protein
VPKCNVRNCRTLSDDREMARALEKICATQHEYYHQAFQRDLEQTNGFVVGEQKL